MIENENSFKQALKYGVNFFVGSGFSVLAKDGDGRKLPIGHELASELVSEFKIQDAASLDLSRISTILEYDNKSAFYAYIKKRFNVNEFDEKYCVLEKLNIKSIFTTNVDNLIHKIFASSDQFYLNDINLRGPTFGDRSAIDYIALHGSILDDNRSISFSSRDLAASFSTNPDSWRFLVNRLQTFPSIFWGHSIEDAGVLEALSPSPVDGINHKEKWLLLRSSTDGGTINYFKALGFQIIIADTSQILEYLDSLIIVPTPGFVKAKATAREIFPQEVMPEPGTVPVRPIIDFYLGAAPSWSDIYSGRLHKTIHLSKNCDAINSGKHTIVVGLPACGKTTLMMQVAAETPFHGYKLVCENISLEKAHLMVSKLGTEKALLFIDNFCDSVEAFQYFFERPNIQLVGYDRDYNFDIISHKIDKARCQMIDVTELPPHDIQEIFSKIPKEIKGSRFCLPVTSEGISPSLFEIMESNIVQGTLHNRFHNALREIEQKDAVLLDFLLVCSYVHKSRIPVSMDMLLAFFRDVVVDYSEIYSMRERLKTMITDYAGELNDDSQDYFVPRSTIVAEAIIEEAPHDALKRVLLRFHKEVSHYRIHRYDIFKRQAYDADLMRRAFPQWHEGLEFYKAVCSIGNQSPYLYQQCALYLANKRRFTEAFDWIDDAIMRSNGKIPSIRNSHAVILFKANIDRQETDGTVQKTLKQSMDILTECYGYDKRKTYHALVYADQALKYFDVYADNIAVGYLETAKRWLTEEYKKSPWHRNVKRLLNMVNKKLA